MGVFDSIASGLNTLMGGNKANISNPGIDSYNAASQAFTSSLGHAIQAKTSRLFGESPEEQAKRYYNKVFPGTNPWERLGTSAGNMPVQAAARRDVSERATARRQMSNQMQMKELELQKDRDVAKINANASVMNKALDVGGSEFAAKAVRSFNGGDVSEMPSGVFGRDKIQQLSLERDFTRLALDSQQITNDMVRISREWEQLTLDQRKARAAHQLDLFKAVTDRVHAIVSGGPFGQIAFETHAMFKNLGLQDVFKPMDKAEFEAWKKDKIIQFAHEDRAPQIFSANAAKMVSRLMKKLRGSSLKGSK